MGRLFGRLARLLLPGATLLLAVRGAGCEDQPLPGTMLGTYKVSAQSKTNSCGAGLGAPNPWVFNADLSDEGSTIYWSWIDGSPVLSGILTNATQASITAQSAANVDPSDAGAGPCTLERADDLELTLAAGSPPPSFSGTISYVFTVPSGSSCADQLVSAGGTYAALPCTISYTLTATRQ